MWQIFKFHAAFFTAYLTFRAKLIASQTSRPLWQKTSLSLRTIPIKEITISMPSAKKGIPCAAAHGIPFFADGIDIVISLIGIVLNDNDVFCHKGLLVCDAISLARNVK